MDNLTRFVSSSLNSPILRQTYYLKPCVYTEHLIVANGIMSRLLGYFNRLWMESKQYMCTEITHSPACTPHSCLRDLWHYDIDPLQ